MINYVNPIWLIPILPLYYNIHLKNLNISLNNYIDIIVNNFKINSNVWNNENYPLLANNYINIIKKIY